MATGILKKPIESVYEHLQGVVSSDIPDGGYKDITLNQSIHNFLLLRLNCSYYSSGRPDYGGTVISPAGLKTFTSEVLEIYGADTSYNFNVKYVDDTTLRISFWGTRATNRCLAIRGILK